MRWTQHVERRTTMLRTAKPRGPDISTPISSLRRDDVADDGDKKARSPGRAWSKPLKPAARGMPGVSGEARGDYTRTLFHFACEAAGALKHPAFPAPSVFEGKISARTRVRKHRGKVKPRHCEGRQPRPGSAPLTRASPGRSPPKRPYA